jgi:hypothetical protein
MMPALSPAAAARIVGQGSAVVPVPVIRESGPGAMPAAPLGPQPMPPAAAPPRGGRMDEVTPTRARQASRLRPVHWVIMACAAVVPLAVWALVVYVAVNGPIGRRPPAPGAAETARPGR